MYSVWVNCEFKCMNPCKRKAERYFIGRHTEENVMFRERENNVKVLTLKTAVMQPQAKECRKLFTVRSGERQGMDSPPEPPEGVQFCQTPLFPYSDWPLLCTSGFQDCEESVSVALHPQVWVICSNCHWKWIHSQASFLLHNLFFSSFFHPKFLAVTFAEQAAVFCVHTGFLHIYLGWST